MTTNSPAPRRGSAATLDEVARAPLASELTAAATRLRALANGATNGPWTLAVGVYGSDGGDYAAASVPGVVDEVDAHEDSDRYGPLSIEDGAYVTALEPRVGLALAALLDDLAANASALDRPERNASALALARLITDPTRSS